MIGLALCHCVSFYQIFTSFDSHSKSEGREALVVEEGSTPSRERCPSKPVQGKKQESGLSGEEDCVTESKDGYVLQAAAQTCKFEQSDK